MQDQVVNEWDQQAETQAQAEVAVTQRMPFEEKKQQDIKFRYIERCGVEDFVSMGMDSAGAEQTMNYVDTLRNRIDQVKHKDAKIKEYAKEEKALAKDKLELFMV